MVGAGDRAVGGKDMEEEQLLGAEPMERSTPEWQQPKWVTPPFVLAQSHVTPPFVLPRAVPAGPPFVLAQQVVLQQPREERARGGQVVMRGHEVRPSREAPEQEVGGMRMPVRLYFLMA